MIIVSACLVGINCNYKGSSKPNEKVIELVKGGKAIPVCPEIFGGQSTPRPPAEILKGDGLGVLSGINKVINPDNSDVTKEFVRGAEEVLNIAKLVGCKKAILKARSPSCGNGKTYDGTFSRTFVHGDGVTAALLKKNGIKVYTEEDLMDQKVQEELGLI